MTNIVLTAMILVNGANAGHKCFEVVPDTYRAVVKSCEACKNGWAPLEAPCTCEYRDVRTGTYHLEAWPDFETPIRKACGLPPLVRTNYVQVCRFEDCCTHVGRAHPFVKMKEPLFMRVVETNGTDCAERKAKGSR